MLQLLRLNHAIVSVAKYQKELSSQMEQVIVERTRNEAALAVSHSRQAVLPGLIASQSQSFPLQRQVVFQNTAHRASLVSGVPVAVAAGLVGGAIEGLVIGFSTSIRWSREQLEKVGSGFSAWGNSIKARFTSSRAR